MTYQPNPDAPIASEQHPELYERMCNARNFIEQVLSAYVKAARKYNMGKPSASDLYSIRETLVADVEYYQGIDNGACIDRLGENLIPIEDELEKLIKENWNGE